MVARAELVISLRTCRITLFTGQQDLLADHQLKTKGMLNRSWNDVKKKENILIMRYWLHHQ
jgi:hypothetical protein